jgi:RNA polymerase sigma-70 factor (ECF subfamily)
MSWDESKEKQLSEVIDRFTNYIKAHIQKYNLFKFGLDADDVFQEVKIKIWKVLHNEKKITNYSSYIKKIVDSSVIDQFRKIKREEGIYLHEKNKKIAEHKNTYIPSHFYDELDIKETVGKAVDNLIESRRKVVKLYLLNMSIEEIAFYFNWSKDKTRNLLYRGLADLKKILKDKDIDYEHQP